VIRRDFVRRSAALAAGAIAGKATPLAASGVAPHDAPPGVTGEPYTRPDLTLWYRRPAVQWVEALPVGNGRLGAMVFGGVERERLQLNEDTLWSGGPRDWNNPGARAALAEVRRRIDAGDYVGADEAAKGMQGPYTESYLPLGDLRLAFEHGDVASRYRRDLDLRAAVAGVSYRIGETTFTRELFVSHPDRALVVRLAADRPGAITFKATLDSPLRHRTAATAAC